MKKILFLFGLINASLFAQIKVDYSFEFSDKKAQREFFQSSLPFNNYEKTLQCVNYTLQFDKNRMVFSPDLCRDYINVDMKEIIYFIDNYKYYRNANSDFVVKEDLSSKDKTYLTSYRTQINWLKEENNPKNILGYKCNKAIGEIYFDNGDGVFRYDKEITVWYTDEIKTDFGPLYCKGLNGLVLEFDDKLYNYTATKIEKDISLKDLYFPNKKIVTIIEEEKLNIEIWNKNVSDCEKNKDKIIEYKDKI